MPWQLQILSYTIAMVTPLQVYQQVTDSSALANLMETYLEDYNSTTNTPMRLVLFTDAMEHVSRICRIISQPMGNALLLGVGCSGRRSLARLAAYMCDYEVFQVEICKGYGNNEWREVGCVLSAGVSCQLGPKQSCHLSMHWAWAAGQALSSDVTPTFAMCLCCTCRI